MCFDDDVDLRAVVLAVLGLLSPTSRGRLLTAALLILRLCTAPPDETVELLLDRRQKRPRIEHENRVGHTALSWATVKDRQPQMEAIVKRGADVNFQNAAHGRTPLIWAAIYGKHRSVRFLLEAGADQNLLDKEGKT